MFFWDLPAVDWRYFYFENTDLPAANRYFEGSIADYFMIRYGDVAFKNLINHFAESGKDKADYFMIR